MSRGDGSVSRGDSGGDVTLRFDCDRLNLVLSCRVKIMDAEEVWVEMRRGDSCDSTGCSIETLDSEFGVEFRITWDLCRTSQSARSSNPPPTLHRSCWHTDKDR